MWFKKYQILQKLRNNTLKVWWFITHFATVSSQRKKYWLAHTHPFNGPFSRTTRVGRYQKGETNLDFTEARASEWQWHQLGICKFAPRSRQNNHASTSPLSFLQAGCPSCRPTNSVKALKTQALKAQILTGTRWSYRLEYSGNYSGPQWPSAGFFVQSGCKLAIFSLNHTTRYPLPSCDHMCLRFKPSAWLLVFTAKSISYTWNTKSSKQQKTTSYNQQYSTHTAENKNALCILISAEKTTCQHH